MKERFELTFARLFSAKRLRWFCTAPEEAFTRFGEVVGDGDQRTIYRNAGSDVLAVAHLDHHGAGTFKFAQNLGVAWSMALDDRLGAYLILDLLPKLGIKVDVLLTTGEESANSTAKYWQQPEDRQYNWMFSFDRRGNDVVTYDYDSKEWERELKAAGCKVGIGSFSDICYLDHLGVHGVNFGTGYQDEHTKNCHVFLWDTAVMVRQFVTFYRMQHDVSWPWKETKSRWYSDSSYSSRWSTEEDCDFCDGYGQIEVTSKVWEECPKCGGSGWMKPEDWTQPDIEEELPQQQPLVSTLTEMARRKPYGMSWGRYGWRKR
jgi:hypothetical protein